MADAVVRAVQDCMHIKVLQLPQKNFTNTINLFPSVVTLFLTVLITHTVNQLGELFSADSQL